jgi:sec-independent protein translocase protein TatA
MEALSIPHLLIIFVIVIIFFGGRRIPEVMRGMGEGIRSFKEGMRGDVNQAPPPSQSAPPAAHAQTVPPTPSEEKKS